MSKGKVYLVGSGPGNPELLTIKGYQSLLAADVILIDRLLPSDFLQRLAIPVADKLVCRVVDGESRWSQEKICEQMVQHALAGSTVVRLKGGDPCIYGRGGDELDYLSSRGIPCELIPGLSSVTAVPTLTGLPLTRHAKARSFSIVTARTAGGAIQSDFPRSDSLVILMGIAVIEQVVDKLLSDGWPHETPIALIERSSLDWERRIVSTLANVIAEQDRCRLSAPSIIVVGDAAHGIRGLNEKPTILFTGLDHTAFRDLGNILHWPALRTVPCEEAGHKLGGAINDLEQGHFDTVLFTDRNGVDSFFHELYSRGIDARILCGSVITFTSQSVRQQLRWHGIFADVAYDQIMPESSANSINSSNTDSMLVISGTHIPHALHTDLQNSGINATFVLLNTLETHPDLGKQLPDHDVLYFVSPAGVKAYHEVYGKNAFEREVWCLGQSTLDTLQSYGVKGKIVIPPKG